MSDFWGTGAARRDGVRLFAFHHAGGSHTLYQGWHSRLPSNWEFRLTDAPGRGKLFGQPHFDDLGDLAEYFLDSLGPELDGSYAFFGHSMGGFVAAEMTQRLLAAGRTLPVWLGLSACRAPGRKPRALRHTLNDEDLRRSVAGLGGTPSEVLEDPEMWSIFGPMIRADLKVVETRRAEHYQPLPMPVTVFAGRRDTSITPDDVEAWSESCRDFRGMRVFEGGHFYFSDNPTPLVEHVIRDIREALEQACDPLV